MSMTTVASVTIPLHTEWRFGGAIDGAGDTDRLEPGVIAAHSATALDDSDWDIVTLPHSPVALSWQHWDPATWEYVWVYRRHFATPVEATGNRVFLEIGAALTSAVVTLNGTLLGEHRGGYLPFHFEITDLLEPAGNLLTVVVDGRPHQNVPPNLPNPAPASSIDYWQPGGLHRDAALRIVPTTYVATVATTHHDELDPAKRRSSFVVTIDATDVPPDATVVVTLRDSESTEIASARTEVTTLQPGSNEVAVELGGLDAVSLWDIDAPSLYTVETRLEVAGIPRHSTTLRTGYREARWEKNGFYLNGTRRYLFGVNRHGLYPFAGFAMPDRVQRRDAEIIKYELNCNFVRASHYPQTPAFLDACDELGLLVWEEPPGWQFVGDQDWQDLAVRDITEMIARDRHRPSIVIWAARLNETPDRPAFYERTEKLVKSLDATRATSGTMLGDFSRTATFQHDVFSYDDYNTVVDADGVRLPVLLPPVEDRPYLVAEAISSRSSPTTFYRRIEHAAVQQHQALDYAQAHELARADERYSGLIAWVAFDYQAGFGNHYHGVKTAGFGDAFRILKPGAAFYRSQVDPAERIVLEPAFTWDPPELSHARSAPGRPEDRNWGPGRRAVIGTNLDRVEVYLGGVHIGSALPDHKRFPHLAYPPAFIDIDISAGGDSDLTVEGYLEDRLVVTRKFAGDREGDSIRLTADAAELVADGRDATRVVIAIVDRFGEPRGHSRTIVNLELTGPAVLVGDNPFDLEQSGGVGAVWIRTLPDHPGDIILRAFNDDFGSVIAQVASV